MGKDEVSDAERAELEMDLQKLKSEYEKSCLRRATTTHEGRRVKSARELLKKLLAKKTVIRELRRQLGDRKYEVAREVIFRTNEDNVPLEEFKRIVPLSDPDTLEEMEEVWQKIK
jgi:hypothetical protein